jgi:hypothetical protein
MGTARDLAPRPVHVQLKPILHFGAYVGVRVKTAWITVAIVATLSVAAAGLAADRDVAAGTGTAAAELRLRPTAAGGPQGVGLFRQTGVRLGGWVVVWGLEPRSRHAVHFHGPRSACGRKADPVAAHADLVADDRGIAYARVSVRSRLQVLRKGFYYNVHAKPASAAENPEIACANVTPIP